MNRIKGECINTFTGRFKCAEKGTEKGTEKGKCRKEKNGKIENVFVEN